VAGLTLTHPIAQKMSMVGCNGCQNGITQKERNTMNPYKKITRIGDRSAKHQYEIQIDRKGGYVLVDANTRSQAAKITKTAGFPVLSVNMVG
jgi:hypothetical protein